MVKNTIELLDPFAPLVVAEQKLSVLEELKGFNSLKKIRSWYLNFS